MKRYLVLGFFVLVSLGFGCGKDGPDRSASTNSRKIEASNAANSDPINGSPTAAASNDRSGVNAAPSDANTELKNKKLKDILAAGPDPSAPKPNIEELLKRSERPAPEDSLFAAALVDIIIERRTFLKHPIIAKVEKVTGTDGKTSLTVITRDGRSFDLDGNAIGAVSTASTFSILRAIGMDEPAVERKTRAAAPASKN